jgi:hypothetical protein
MYWFRLVLLTREAGVEVGVGVGVGVELEYPYNLKLPFLSLKT